MSYFGLEKFRPVQPTEISSEMIIDNIRYKLSSTCHQQHFGALQARVNKFLMSVGKEAAKFAQPNSMVKMSVHMFDSHIPFTLTIEPMGNSFNAT